MARINRVWKEHRPYILCWAINSGRCILFPCAMDYTLHISIGSRVHSFFFSFSITRSHYAPHSPFAVRLSLLISSVCIRCYDAFFLSLSLTSKWILRIIYTFCLTLFSLKIFHFICFMRSHLTEGVPFSCFVSHLPAHLLLKAKMVF